MKTHSKIALLIVSSLIALLSSQCASAEGVNSSGVSLKDFPNPERGWYRSMETQDASLEGLIAYKNSGVTLVAFEAYLGAYLDRDIDRAKLNEIDRAFSFARRAGLSVIYRAAYDFRGKSNPEPHNLNTIIKHIGQHKPIFEKYEDILFNIQAGFLGPWGEWHHSRFGDQKNPDDPVAVDVQKQVLAALLDAAPPSVSIAVRRPQYIRNMAGTAPLTAAEAFSGSTLSRLAFHNDALMSEKTDMDTYIDPDYQPIEKEFAWINNHTRFTPFVGETNQVSSYNDTKNAIPFLNLMNAHSLNIEYHPDVLRKWKRTQYGGMNAYDYIGIKLGYRFELIDATTTAKTQAGGTMEVTLQIQNTGFGHLLKEKNFELVLKNGNRLYRAKINEDARFWNKNETINRTYTFALPGNINAGNWEVYLSLSSTFQSLENNPAYSVRFASNDEIWDETLGMNRIGFIVIEQGGSGDSVELKQIDN